MFFLCFLHSLRRKFSRKQHAHLLDPLTTRVVLFCVSLFQYTGYVMLLQFIDISSQEHFAWPICQRINTLFLNS